MPNHLIHQSSPYLLQHANNPVDWYPWSEHALELARKTDKPILLSIGYAACHWCHVMEEESFENPDIAALMNRLFVCIKVDREERPDLDKIYQFTHQMLTQRPGGWPLTLALTPGGHAPFFAGTYFPPEPRFNMPGFGELLEKIAGHYRTHSARLENYHVSFNQALMKLNPDRTQSAIPDPEAALARAVQALEQQFDPEFGGFGKAPKFAHPTQIELLLYQAGRSRKTDGPAAGMARKTLNHMARGGLFDHLGGGFFRYSVDRQWRIPHFEKMLYDNAQLLALYCDALQLFADRHYATTARATADWVMAEMQQPGGGYASTLDADSDGEEGRYYVWSETDLRAVLAENDYAMLENYFGLYGEPNFENNWHFNLNPAANLPLLEDNPEVLKAVNTAKARLLEIRGQRNRPGLDDKILTSWNGLMIQGMIRAARTFSDPAYLESAQRSIEFVKSNLWQSDRLLAAYSQGKAHLNAYLDDYAFMLSGLMESLQCRWRNEDLEFAISICDAMLDKFEDPETGGFFFTSHDHERLLYRPKNGADDSIPSGNGAAIAALLRLGSMLGESRYLKSAQRALELFSGELEHRPSVNGSMTAALQSVPGNHVTVVIRGRSPGLEQWMEKINRTYRPGVTVFGIPAGVKSLRKDLALRTPRAKTVAYLCRGSHCTAPLFSLEELAQRLAEEA